MREKYPGRMVAFLLASLLLVFVAAMMLARWRHTTSATSSTIKVSIGVSSDPEAIQEIVQQIQANPHAKEIEVAYTDTWLSLVHLDDETNRYTMTYSLQDHSLTQRNDYFGYREYANVTESILRKVVQAGGASYDLDKYGCPSYPQ